MSLTSIIIQYDYRVAHTSVHKYIKIKDLGVTFDLKLIFSNHINGVGLSATKMLDIILRATKRFNNTPLLLDMYVYAWVYIHQ